MIWPFCMAATVARSSWTCSQASWALSSAATRARQAESVMASAQSTVAAHTQAMKTSALNTLELSGSIGRFIFLGGSHKATKPQRAEAPEF
jgi:hypothetical protein